MSTIIPKSTAYDDRAADHFYHHWAPSGAFRNIFDRTMLAQIRHQQAMNDRINVLEIGCGHGTWIKRILEKVERPPDLYIVGIDPSIPRIHYARQDLGTYPNVQLLEEYFQDFVTDRTFHIICFIEVLQALPKQFYARALDKAYQLLEEGGVTIIIDRERYSYYAVIRQLKRKLGRGGVWIPLRYPSFRHLSRLARKSGFQVTDVEVLGSLRGLLLKKQ